MPKSLELKEQRAKVYAEMQDLRAKMGPDGKFTDAVAETTWRNSDAEFVRLTEQITEAEKWEAREREMLATEQEIRDRNKPGAKKDAELRTYESAWEKYMRRGSNQLDDVERRLLETRGTSTQVTGTDSLGGYTVPEGFSGELEVAMKWYGAMLEAARILNTSSGNPLPWPTLDDTNASGAGYGFKTEATGQVGVQDMTFSEVVFNSYVADSGMVKFSEELLMDEEVGLGGIINDALADRLGRHINYYTTLGTGTSQPKGVVTAAAAGKTAASATAFTKGELIDLLHSVDKAYRNNPKAAFMMNDLILAAARKLDVGNTDTVQIFYPSLVTGEPDRLLGKPIYVNNDMASTQAASAKIVLFGDFSKFIIRRVGGIRTKRLNELYADYLNVGVFAWTRYDSDLIAANAIKYLRNA